MIQRMILVVDDQKINRDILKKILSDSYQVLEAEDGEQALKILYEYGADISAVILDLVMPKFDGYQTLKVMSSSPLLSKIPVIVASQEEKGDKEEKAFQYGARDFITKPYYPGVLKRRLANLIELYETSIRLSAFERDQLTGLYNKDTFYLKVEQLLNRYPETEFMIIGTNIERFKLINDSQGNDEGDRLIQHMADFFRKKIESLGGICARSRADRFFAILPKSQESLEELVEESRAIFDNYPLNMKMFIKFGVYVIDDKEISIPIMCDRAMLAVDNMKGKYNLAYTYYDDTIRQKMIREQQIVNEMKKALANQEFQVYFQPKYALKGERISGAEALVRWTHPELGFISPGEFIPLFERNGFVTELDLYVWDKTCETVRNWIDQGKPVVPVSVNVSRKDIYNEQLLEQLQCITSRHRLEPNMLHLEITETAYTEETKQLIEVVDRLKEKGFVIEMDDFGSGYSSLNTLKDIEIDILKIDMKFLSGQVRSAKSEKILASIVKMAEWLEMQVIVEGVETKEEKEFLESIGCKYVQGFYYAKPMPIHEFEEKLSAEL